MHLHRTLLLVVLFLSFLLTPLPPAPPTAHAASLDTCVSEWTPVPMPVPASGNPFLRRASSSASDNVWAVGYLSFGQGNPNQTLIEHWDGEVWTIVPSPSVADRGNGLSDVAVLDKSNAWAVGLSVDPENVSHMLMLRWDGSTWTIVSPPKGQDDTGSLVSISGVATNDVWAVGTWQGNALIVHWNGSEWQSVPSPINLSFTRVIAKAADDVWALGVDAAYNATILHWNGSAWSVFTSFEPDGAIIDFVVLQANNIWVVGGNTQKYSSTTRRWHWDGTSWNSTGSDSGPGKSGVSLTIAGMSPDNLWEYSVAEGLVSKYILSHRNSTGWHNYDRFVDYGFFPRFHLASISAVSDQEFWLVGTSAQAPVAMHGIFTCTAPPSGPLTLLLPAEGEISTALTQSFSWQGSTDTSYYNLKVSAKQSNWEADFEQLWKPTITLHMPNGEYSWLVQACNYVGCGEWSLPVSWTRQVPTPQTPQLVSPPTGSSIAADSVTLTWAAVTNANNYIGELYKDSPTNPPFRNIYSSQSSDGFQDLTEGSYFWHVKACGPGGCSDWSEMFRFDIFHPAPDRPTLLIPKAKATVKTQRPWFGWSSSGPVLYYRLQLRKDSRGGSIIFTQPVFDAPNYHWDGPLSNGIYYWRVKACNEFRCSKWTKGRKFIIEK